MRPPPADGATDGRSPPPPLPPPDPPLCPPSPPPPQLAVGRRSLLADNANLRERNRRLEDHARDPVELRERVDDLRQAPDRDRGGLLVHERRVEVHRRDAVVDREAVQVRAGVDRGPEIRRALCVRRALEQRLDRWLTRKCGTVPTCKATPKPRVRAAMGAHR